MKKFYFTMLAFIASVALFAQSTTRNVVVLEIGTGTWCQYCPGAAKAADQLITEGKSIAVIENHNGDTYANDYSNNRNTYYTISGYPTGVFDGVTSSVGGAACPSGNIYTTYLPLYNTAIGTPSPISMCISGSHTGLAYTVNVKLIKLDAVSGADLRLHLVLTESHISQTWQGCMTEVNFVNRLMVPGNAGTSFSFSGGDVQNFTLNFNMDASWNAANCELVAFVQDNPTKAVYNGIKSSLANLPAAMLTYTDFSGSPLSGCAPVNTTFSATATGVTAYNWTFPGGNPATSTLASPVISYTSAGTNNVSLEISNGVCRESHTKTGYVVLTAAPVAPVAPQGNTAMCINPGTQTYTISPVPDAVTYNWVITPQSAGTLTPSGTSCAVAYSPSYTGTATLKAQGSNSCGGGAWSPDLSIHISNPPAQPAAPTGLTSFCENTFNTTYTVTAVPNATAYAWEIIPNNAGILTNNGTSAVINWATGWDGAVTLKVAAVTYSCQGPWSAVLNITVNPAPATFNITGGGTYCGQGGTGVPIGLSGSEAGTTYTLFLGGNATSNTVVGTGGPVSFGNLLSAGFYDASATITSTTCSSLMNGTVAVMVDPEPPLAPEDPNGPDNVYTSITPSSNYSTNGGNYATTYTWQLTPAAAGNISGSGTTSTVSWNQNFIGTASVAVQGINTCGLGSFSNQFQVTVQQTVGIHEKDQARLVAIYPNPAKGNVKIIPFHAMKASVKVTNSIGLTVMNLDGVSLDGEYKLDLTGLHAGLYFISINENGNTQVLKLILE